MFHCCSLRWLSFKVSNCQWLEWLCVVSVFPLLPLKVSYEVSQHCSQVWRCVVPRWPPLSHWDDSASSQVSQCSSHRLLCVLVYKPLPLTGVTLLHPRCSSVSHWGGFASSYMFHGHSLGWPWSFKIYHCCSLGWLCIISVVPVLLTGIALCLTMCLTSAHRYGSASLHVSHYYCSMAWLCVVSNATLKLNLVAPCCFKCSTVS